MNSFCICMECFERKKRGLVVNDGWRTYIFMILIYCYDWFAFRLKNFRSGLHISVWTYIYTHIRNRKMQIETSYYLYGRSFQTDPTFQFCTQCVGHFSLLKLLSFLSGLSWKKTIRVSASFDRSISVTDIQKYLHFSNSSEVAS